MASPSPDPVPDQTVSPSVQAHSSVSPSEFITLCQTGTLEQIRAAVADGADVNAADEAGNPPLRYVIWRHAAHERNDDEAILPFLLSCGADVNKPDMSGNTPLMWAVNSSFRKSSNQYRALNSIERLVQLGANLEAENGDGRTALSIAATGGLPGNLMAEKLLTLGANINTADHAGATPLMRAASWGYPDTVKTMLKAKAVINAKDRKGRTALDYALANKGTLDDYYLKPLVAMLRKAGAKHGTKAAFREPLP